MHSTAVLTSFSPVTTMTGTWGYSWETPLRISSPEMKGIVRSRIRTSTVVVFSVGATCLLSLRAMMLFIPLVLRAISKLFRTEGSSSTIMMGESGKRFFIYGSFWRSGRECGSSLWSRFQAGIRRPWFPCAP